MNSSCLGNVAKLDTHDAEMRVFCGCGENRTIGGGRSDVKALGARVSGINGRTSAKDDTVGVHAGLDASRGGTGTLRR
jgi:hypothetical protein